MVLLTRLAFYLNCTSISASGLCGFFHFGCVDKAFNSANSKFQASHRRSPSSHNKVLSVTLLRYRILTVGFILLVSGFWKVSWELMQLLQFRIALISCELFIRPDQHWSLTNSVITKPGIVLEPLHCFILQTRCQAGKHGK